MKLVFLLAAALLMVGCQTNTAGKLNKVSTSTNAFVGTVSKRSCNIVGLNWKHSDAKLKRGLCGLARRYGKVYVTSSCRTRKNNMGVKRSYHLHSRGCKAADLYIKGVKSKTILKWWAKNIGGGRGYYACRNFVHVDTGENRTWNWNLCRKRKNRKRRA